MDKHEMIEEIRSRIQAGEKTSSIINSTKYPIDLIKAIKSEELERDKAEARAADKEGQQKHMTRKKEAAYLAFLKRIGQDPDKIEQAKREAEASLNNENLVVGEAPNTETSQAVEPTSNKPKRNSKKN